MRGIAYGLACVAESGAGRLGRRAHQVPVVVGTLSHQHRVDREARDRRLARVESVLGLEPLFGNQLYAARGGIEPGRGVEKFLRAFLPAPVTEVDGRTI